MPEEIPVFFHFEETKYVLKSEHDLKKWLYAISQSEGKQLQNLNIIFCKDEYLKQLNKKYLDKETLTDVISFDNSDEQHKIEGDVFISLDRIAENAKSLNIGYEDELLRVMVHGLLHLLGYDDKSRKDKSLMRLKEDKYLEQFSSS